MTNSRKDSPPKLDLIPVILSGGSGSRLWPLSRESFPKQYLKLNEKNKLSLLQNTYLRLIGLNNLKDPIIISNQEQRFIVAEQMREINVNPNTILLEPMGKNTAPAITLAVLKSLETYKDPTLLILSSDHKIEDEESFREVIEEGLLHSNNGRLVTFGIVPDCPETGYGYIESYDELSNVRSSSKIKKFIEKPDLELAKKFIKNPRFFWNSGIFLFKASVFLEELKKFEPQMIKTCEYSIKKGINDLDFFRVDEQIFGKCPDKPIDIALMEKTNLGSILPLKAGWNDIGTWNSVWKISEKDKYGNSLKGKTIIENSSNCYLRSENRLLVGINLNDIVAIETNDAVLISNKDSTQKVKKIVNKLKKNNFKEAKNNNKSYRPWGTFTRIEEGITWQVKRLEINPKASISLQMHKHRSEHWIIVSGIAKVEIDDKVSFLRKNESTFIPLGAKHRLSNPEEIPLVLIEVQSGSYLGEDDIIRFEDIYGRNL